MKSISKIFLLATLLSPAAAQAGLVAHFPLDTDGDATVGGFQAALADGVTFEEPGANENTGTSALFEGAGLIQFDWDEALNPESFTLIGWAKSNGGAGGFQSFVTSRNDLNPDSEGYILYDANDGNWQYWSGNGIDDGNWQTAIGSAVEVGEWQHVAIAYDSNAEQKLLYVNGELVAAADDRIEPNTTTPLNIGAGQDFGDGFFFDGNIDDIGLYDVPLSGAEITYMMTNGVQELGDPRISVPPVVNLTLGNSPLSVTLEISNGGSTKDLNITTAVFSGPNAANFSVGDLPGAIEAGDQGELEISFDPLLSLGAISAILTLESDDPISSSVTIELAGKVPNPSGPALIAHFPLDSDGNSADGTFIPSLEEGVEYGAAGANGATGTSATFDGASRIQHDWSEALNPESFTLALWAKSNGGAGGFQSPVTSRHDLNPDSQGYVIYDASDGNWQYWSGNGIDAGNWQVSTGPAVNVGEWQHVAITYDNEVQQKTLYIDGVEEVVADEIVFPNDTTPFNIGAGQDFGDGFWFDGQIDDIGLWDGALSPDQIALVMTAGVTALGSDPGLSTPGRITLDLSGADQMLTTSITNTGKSLDLTIDSIEVAGDDADKFAITTPTPITLAPGASQELAFTFTPAGATGNISALFVVTSNDPKVETFIVQLSGLIQDPKLEPSAEAIEYGTVTAPASKTLTITNSGATQALAISAVTITGNDVARFSIVSKPDSIAIGATGDIVIAFDAGGLEGNFSAVLEISSNDPGTPTTSIPLTASVPITDPLVAYWPLDEEEGAVVATDTVREREGVAENVEFGQAGARPYTGTSAFFDGASSRIQLEHTMDLNPTSFTLTAWAKSEGGAGAWNSLVTSRHDLNNDGQRSEGFILYDSEPGGVWTFWSGNGDGPGNWQTLDGPEVTLEEWEHVTLRYDDSIPQKELFINGESVAVQDESIAPNTETPFNIGSGQDFGDGFWFAGNIDDLALFRTALSDDDIAFIYENGVLAFTGGSQFRFQVTNIQQDPANKQVTLTFASRLGGSYILERTTDLSTNNWIELADGIEAEGEETTITDTTVEGDATVYYYRFKEEG
ncbi:MAG: choice-of-anchor D domain-containing protein [Verrucomicrobiae bacterium]|nr:choice-of-anchor D domain-containing protein [Verrucomicrobiae bacterium]